MSGYGDPYDSRDANAWLTMVVRARVNEIRPGRVLDGTVGRFHPGESVEEDTMLTALTTKIRVVRVIDPATGAWYGRLGGAVFCFISEGDGTYMARTRLIPYEEPPADYDEHMSLHKMAELPLDIAPYTVGYSFQGTAVGFVIEGDDDDPET